MKPDNFFNLSEFKHKELFVNNKPAFFALKILNQYLKKKLKNKTIMIGPNTVVEPGVVIKGPAIIGKNCQIRHGAYIRDGVVIGDNCIIGNSTEVKHSILFNKVMAAHLNYVGDSILGNQVNLGGGAKLANMRLDGKKVTVNFKGKKIKTNMLKLGSIIGDNVDIGCNAVLNPGTVLSKKCKVYPLTSVKGFHKPESVIK